ncbi:MAG: hypothetical protein CL828_01240 [Crocinitomicaceae bacterium]|nr:hypothetical protein [Crocinitomicaceae bacterium]
MQKSERVLQAGWSMCLAVALFGFCHSPKAVAWLLATVSCLAPLLISLFLNGEKWDRSFFTIAVISLIIVAVAVSLGQWAVLDASPAWVAFLPLGSLLMWIIHERKFITKRQ